MWAVLRTKRLARFVTSPTQGLLAEAVEVATRLPLRPGRVMLRSPWYSGLDFEKLQPRRRVDPTMWQRQPGRRRTRASQPCILLR